MELDNGTPPSDTGAPFSNPTPAPTPTPTFDGPSWMADLPEDLKASKSVSKFKDVENLARGYINAEQLLGRDKIPVPRTDEEFAEVYSRLGRPDAPEGYEVNLKELVQDEWAATTLQDEVKNFLPVAHNLGLNKKQAHELVKFYAQNTIAERERMESAAEYDTRAAAEVLRKDFGRDYDKNIELANRTISSIASKDLLESINATGLGRNPEFIKMLVKIGSTHLEDRGVDKLQAAGTQNSLKGQIEAAQRDPAYLDNTHPGHRRAVDNVRLMFEQLTRK